MATSLVAIRLRSVVDAVEVIEQTWQQGDAVLPLDAHAPDHVTADLVRRLRPAALVTNRPDGTGRKVVRLTDDAAVPDGTGLVVASSGSTGEPKGVVLSHAALEASAAASVERLGCRPGQRWWLDLPLHHVAGLQVLRRSALLGSAPVLADADGRMDDADWMALVPTQLDRLLSGEPELAGKGVLLGGSAAPPDLVERGSRAGIVIVRSYGMTETCGGCVYDGRPLSGVEVVVDPVGVIRVRGPVVATGLRQPDGSTAPLTDGDGWLSTNDLGRIDDGVLTVLGRADTVIVTGGENVAAEAVEAALRRHSEVVDAAVFGPTDPEWGQRVVALVVPTDPTAPPSPDALREHVAGHLGRHAAPKEVRFVADLPRTGLGKIDRTALH